MAFPVVDSGIPVRQDAPTYHQDPSSGLLLPDPHIVCPAIAQPAIEVLQDFPDLSTSILSDAPFAYAILAKPRLIRAFIEPDTIGAYFLLDISRPIYVGRSDTCLAQRLSTHNHLDKATHIVWEPCLSPVAAYFLEAAWFHLFRDELPILNDIHPAKPEGWTGNCPFCHAHEEEAFSFALYGMAA